MNKQALRSDLLLLLTAAIWGFGFVAQRSGMEYTGPFTYNAIRFMLGSLSLLPLVVLGKGGDIPPGGAYERGKAAASVIIAGSCLFAAVALQQIGLMFTTVGNSGFITSLYVVLTPIFGVFLGRKTGLPTWVGAFVTLAGLYCLSAVKSGGGINPGDIITAACAALFACHVLVIDRFVKHIDPIRLSAGQFAWCSLLALIAALLLEPHINSWASLISGAYEGQPWRPLPVLVSSLMDGSFSRRNFISGAIPILYGGLASVGIAYTLQVVAQKNAPPAHATIILCLESSFAAFGGIVILGEKPGAFTFLGFALMLVGMLISQWEVIAGGNRR
ncbi:MAG: DMT family transporter [Treponema sp.]|jgi:drug/metabolite transporter (DMT)-like permease|nr:DMT family transporter [Treponema sp.]